MDPLSIVASVIAILQISGTSGQALNKLLSLRDAPQHVQQLWNEVEALRGKSQLGLPNCVTVRTPGESNLGLALLLEIESSLQNRRNHEEYAKIETSISPLLETVRAHVQEFEQLVR
jgi:hypothetical protein